MPPGRSASTVGRAAVIGAAQLQAGDGIFGEQRSATPFGESTV